MPQPHSVPGEMTSPKQTIAARLLRLREEHGQGDKPLSQDEAGRRIGKGERQWQRWERGVNQPRAEMLEKIAREFGFDAREFYEDAPPDRLATLEARVSQIERLLATNPSADAPVADPDQAGRLLESNAQRQLAGARARSRKARDSGSGSS